METKYECTLYVVHIVFLLCIFCHLYRYNFKNYQYILALVFAIEEINDNPNLLPNISLGFDFYNVRFIEKETLMNAVIWLTARVQTIILPNYNCKKRNFTAALTGTSWITSAQIGTLLQLFKFPQVRKFGLWELRVSSLCYCIGVFKLKEWLINYLNLKAILRTWSAIGVSLACKRNINVVNEAT